MIRTTHIYPSPTALKAPNPSAYLCLCLFKKKIISNSLHVVSVVRVHPLGHEKSTGCHKGERLSLLKQQPTTYNSNNRGWGRGFFILMIYWPVWLYAGFVHVIPVAVSWGIQQSCHVQKPALWSFPLHLMSFHSSSGTLPQLWVVGGSPWPSKTNAAFFFFICAS